MLLGAPRAATPPWPAADAAQRRAHTWPVLRAARTPCSANTHVTGLVLRACDAGARAASEATQLAASALARHGDCAEVRAVMQAAEGLMAHTLACIELTKQLAAGAGPAAHEQQHTAMCPLQLQLRQLVKVHLPGLGWPAQAAHAAEAAHIAAAAASARHCKWGGAAVVVDEDGSEEVMSAWSGAPASSCLPGWCT